MCNRQKMNKKPNSRVSSPPIKKARPVRGSNKYPDFEDQKNYIEKFANIILHPVKEETKADLDDTPAVTHAQYDINEAFNKSEVERFIEISKHFSSPLRKTASYICENCLVSYPNPYRIEYKRGGITTQHIRFSNLTLEPVYIKLYKIIPDLEQLKFINLSLSICKRIPPGLSFNLGFVYDDVNEKPSCNAKMIFVASRKTTTPCYQICEIELQIDALKTRLVMI